MKRAQYRIPVSKKNTAILKQLNAAGQIVFDEYYIEKDAYVLTLSDAETEVLKQHEIKAEQLKRSKTQPVKKLLPRKGSGSDDDSDDNLSTGFVTDYMDAAQVAARITALAAEFPLLCQLSNLPYTTSGYDGGNAALSGPANVQLLRITNDPASLSRPGLLLICGTHAREWVNPLVAIEFAEQLLRNYNPGSADADVMLINRIVEEGDVFIVPVMNPDGLNFSRHDDADWRKNRRVNSMGACPGVDNNRNYEVYFGEPGSSPSECSDGYHGPNAFSEPENKNIQYIIEQYPNILIGVDSHSQGEKIFRPTVNGGVAIGSLPVFPGDETIYASLESAAVTAIQNVSGTTYEIGSTSNHAGTSDEYMFFAHRIFGFDFECALMHQPPIASGLISVQEVTAALRTLAIKAIDLELATSTPVDIVQCIDRTGSMITFGYEEAARANASRFVDLMSIGDRAAVVSFADPSADPSVTPPADRAVIEHPLTLINDAGDYGAIIASIQGIGFGGWTSIGAGLSKAAGLLTTGPNPKAIVLLSDGFENRDPSAASVLASFPSDIRVFTIALGSMADVPLMQTIATQTGGVFYQSPDSLQLHEIYNLIRTGASDDDLLLNKKVNASEDDHAGSHKVFVETGADKLTVSLSWEDERTKPQLIITDPAGRTVHGRDWGVSSQQREGYLIIQIDRPMPGHWHIQTMRLQAAHVIAAFIRSPIKLRWQTRLEKIQKRNVQKVFVKLQLPPNIRLTRMTGLAQLRNVQPFDRQEYEKMKRAEWLDQFPSRFNLSPRPQTADPQLADNRMLAHLQPYEIAPPKKKKKNAVAERTFQFSLDAITRPGVYQVDLHVEGWLNDKFRFERLMRVDVGSV